MARNTSRRQPKVAPVLVEPDEQADHHRQTRLARQTEIAEDYVELIADLIDSTGEARSADISRRLGVTHASVTKMVARLQQSGLVTTQPYRAIFLTDEGAAYRGRIDGAGIRIVGRVSPGDRGQRGRGARRCRGHRAPCQRRDPRRVRTPWSPSGGGTADRHADRPADQGGSRTRRCLARRRALRRRHPPSRNAARGLRAQPARPCRDRRDRRFRGEGGPRRVAAVLTRCRPRPVPRRRDGWSPRCRAMPIATSSTAGSWPGTRCVMSANRLPSSLPRIAIWPRTPPRWSRSTTRAFPRYRIARDALAPGAADRASASRRQPAWPNTKPATATWMCRIRRPPRTGCPCRSASTRGSGSPSNAGAWSPCPTRSTTG